MPDNVSDAKRRVIMNKQIRSAGSISMHTRRYALRLLAVAAVALMSLTYAWACGGGIGPGPEEPSFTVKLSATKTNMPVCDSVTITAMASDKDLVGGILIDDPVTQYSWSVNGQPYPAGDNLTAITLHFSTPGIEKIDVTCDDADTIQPPDGGAVTARDRYKC